MVAPLAIIGAVLYLFQERAGDQVGSASRRDGPPGPFPIRKSGMSDPQQDNTAPERRYAVMTDSHRPFDRSVLARMRPDRSRETGFWTEDRPEAVWVMDGATAEEVLAGLSLNNPRIVRAEKALTLITAQRDAKADRAAPAREEEALPDGP